MEINLKYYLITTKAQQKYYWYIETQCHFEHSEKSYYANLQTSHIRSK